jgi:hypothetical protein
MAWRTLGTPATPTGRVSWNSLTLFSLPPGTVGRGGIFPSALSVLQTLYYCRPFRERLLAYASEGGLRDGDENILTCLAELFLQASPACPLPPLSERASLTCLWQPAVLSGGGAR